eukprot:CAMPEP_0113846302 /NCGR_PEP_ID=MMETSP0372-20130328/1234_1 /TAXON_ID=340204 /ORGANISM="Lankesteria abbotti" /LENGTH=160 /DNA_ID=CAMNT_0000815435 /DNA_START=10 /DNA_END=492 /DNA_ORIENTATION=+ /assembly_acc=CAM_ASM_000359
MATCVAPGRKFSLIPKKNRREIYEYVFKEGVIVVEKNPNLEEHPHIHDVPNLHVMMIMKSLKSRDFVDEQFNWRHNYYILKNSGIEHLRQYLHLPSGVCPATFTRQSKAPPRKDEGMERADNQFRGGDDRRGGFGRGRPGGGDRADRGPWRQGGGGFGGE